jgi:ATP-binding cassette, subfamily B, bacterial
MSKPWSTLIWPSSRAGDAVAALACARRLQSTVDAGALQTGATLEIHAQISVLAASLGLEAEPIKSYYNEVQTLLAQAAGAILEVKVLGETGLLLVVKGGRKWLTLLTPDLHHRRVSTHVISLFLRAPLEETLASTLEPLLKNLPSTRHTNARRALLDTQLAGMSISVGWLLRSSPGAPFLSQLYRFGLCGRALRLVCAYAVAYGLWICMWWLIGAAALEGHYDKGWWQAWVLLLISLVGSQALSNWWQTQFVTGTAALLKRRLMHGALRLDRDQVRREGGGQLLGQVLEAEAIENLALGGGLTAALAAIEVIVTLLVLTYGAAGGAHAAVLLLWIGLTAIVVWRYVDKRRTWTTSRLGLTHYLTEQMLGHRTRLVQQPIALWHKGEDDALSHYGEVSKNMDRWAILLTVLVPRGWLIVGLIALAPALFSDGSNISLAVGLGGCLLGYSALQKCTHGLMQLAAAAIAWDQVALMFRAGRSEALSTALPNVAARSDTVLVAKDVVFRYHSQRQALVRGVDLQVGHGERILLEGPSGGGKSTLANLVTGLRVPESGLLLLNGLDRQTLRDAWRRQAVNVPQFHENHIFSESLAFNLLLGRNWPPTPADMEEAETVCRGLGLGNMLERMPSGLWQIIGESGWRLSHGERSRVYLARALLQQAALMVFDESFAALDPENLDRSIKCVIARAPSLIVIAHP